MKIACFGDVHNDSHNLKLLYSMLEHESLDEIYHLGDLIDRGPDPAGVISFCIEKNLKGVLGNHCGALMKKHVNNNAPPNNPDKLRSYHAILSTPGGIEYFNSLPHVLVVGNSILTHAGVDPYKPIEKQNSLCSYVAMVNPKEPGTSRWWSVDRKGRTEESNRAEGWVRWYEDYDHPYHVFHGHSVHREAKVTPFPKQPSFNKVALDTGSYFTGVLSAAVIGPNGLEKIISTPRKREPNFYE